MYYAARPRLIKAPSSGIIKMRRLWRRIPAKPPQKSNHPKHIIWRLYKGECIRVGIIHVSFMVPFIESDKRCSKFSNVLLLTRTRTPSHTHTPHQSLPHTAAAQEECTTHTRHTSHISHHTTNNSIIHTARPHLSQYIAGYLPPTRGA